MFPKETTGSASVVLVTIVIIAVAGLLAVYCLGSIRGLAGTLCAGMLIMFIFMALIAFFTYRTKLAR